MTSFYFQQPGKLNIKDYSLVTDAIARMNVGNKETGPRLAKIGKSAFGHAPLATPEPVDLGSEYAQVAIYLLSFLLMNICLKVVTNYNKL
jgi:hypothetical protein